MKKRVHCPLNRRRPTAARGRWLRARTWRLKPIATRGRWWRPTVARTWRGRPTAARTRWLRARTWRGRPTAARGRKADCNKNTIVLLSKDDLTCTLLGNRIGNPISLYKTNY